jgi:hypothetical protein
MKKKTLVHAGLLVCCLLIDLFVGAQTNTKGKVLVCGCTLIINGVACMSIPTR